MRPAGQLEAGSDNTGLECALESETIDPPLPDRVGCGVADSIIDGFRSGTDLPGYLQGAPSVVLGSKPSETYIRNTVNDSGTLFIVRDDVDFPSDITLRNFGIIADKKLKTGSNTTIVEDVLFAACEDVEMGSDVVIGSANVCSANQPTISVHVFSGADFKVGSNVQINGTQIVAAPDKDDHEFDMGSNLVDYRATAIQWGADIKIGSEVELRGCGSKSLAGQLFGVAGGGALVRLVE